MSGRPKLEADEHDDDHELALKLDELEKEEKEKQERARRVQEEKDERLAKKLAARVQAEEAQTKEMLVIEIPDSDGEHGVVVKKEVSTTPKTPTPKTPASSPSRGRQLFVGEPHTPLTRATPTSKSTGTASDDSSSGAFELSASEKRAYRKPKRQAAQRERKAKHGKHSKDLGKSRMRDGKKEKSDETPKRAKTSVPPPPSISPSRTSPPPSVPPLPAPPAAAAAPSPAAAVGTALRRNEPGGAKRGRKPKHTWTIDEYLHLAGVMSAPRFETPTVALRTLHRGHLLLDITSPNVLRTAWKQLCTGVTSPVHDPRAARALGATEAQVDELRKKIREYNRKQIVQQENADQPVEPLIAQQMEERAAKEKEARKQAKEARGETVGKALLRASQELVKATKDAMTMYAQLHKAALEHVEDTYGHLSSSEDEDEDDDSASDDNSIFTE